MGLKFRKSIKIAPGVKLNFGKKSSSVTFGGKGLHHTISSTGRKTTSIGIPGTGISYSKTTGSKKKKAQDFSMKSNNCTADNNSQNFSNNKKWYEKTGWIILLLILFFPLGLFLMWKSDWKKTPKILISIFFGWIVIASLFSPKLEQAILTADTGQIYDINSQVLIDISTTPEDYDLSPSMFETSGGKLLEENDKFFFTTSDPGDYVIAIADTDVDSNQITLSFEDKAAKEREAAEKLKAEQAAKAEEERIKAEQAAKAEEEKIKAEQQAQEEASSQSVDQQNNDPVVYITNTGNKYHAGGCRFLKKSKIEKHLSDVKGNYQPCGVCNPPT